MPKISRKARTSLQGQTPRSDKTAGRDKVARPEKGARRDKASRRDTAAIPTPAAQAAKPQVAALPLRWKDGKLRVLLITSRTTRRWIIPKGWLMDGETPARAAEIEAIEEAGAVGRLNPKPLGHYHYRKVLSDTDAVLCRVTVYPLTVTRLDKAWKEQAERTRKWVSAKEAARRVHEPELAEILRGLARQTQKKSGRKALLSAT